MALEVEDETCKICSRNADMQNDDTFACKILHFNYFLRAKY